MTAWESYWAVVGSSMLGLLLTFMMVGGGFFLALAVVALIPVALAVAAAAGAGKRRPPEMAMEEPRLTTDATASAATHVPNRGGTWPVYAFSGFLVAGYGAAAVHVWLGLYHLAFIALAATATGMVLVLGETLPAFARRWRSELALVDSVAAPGQAATLQALASTGRCAWGYREADRWSIAADGQVTPRVCRAVAEGLASALAAAKGQAAGECQFACKCPMVQREVAFGLRRMPAAA